MGRVVLKKRALPRPKVRFTRIRRPPVADGDKPAFWDFCTKATQTAWRNRPQGMVTPDLDSSVFPRSMCFDCERPVQVTEYCDGNWKIERETCQWHQYLPDRDLVSACDHYKLPILFPVANNVKTYHVGGCVMPDLPIFSGRDGPAQSIFFKRCTGIYANSLGERIDDGKPIGYVQIGDMPRVPFQRAAPEDEIPEYEPFELRYANAILKEWGKDTQEMKDLVRKRYLGTDFRDRCSMGGRGLKAGER